MKNKIFLKIKIQESSLVSRVLEVISIHFSIIVLYKVYFLFIVLSRYKRQDWVNEWAHNSKKARMLHQTYLRVLSRSFPHSKVNLMMQLNCHIVKMHGGGVECIQFKCVCLHVFSIFYSNRWSQQFNRVWLLKWGFSLTPLFKGWHIKQNSIDFYRLPQTHLLWRAYRHVTLYVRAQLSVSEERKRKLLLSTFWWFHFWINVTKLQLIRHGLTF